MYGKLNMIWFAIFFGLFSLPGPKKVNNFGMHVDTEHVNVCLCKGTLNKYIYMP